MSPLGIVLAHQQEIERMSSFRDQLGEDWLRYQHHLDGGSTSSVSTTVAVGTKQPTVYNGLSTTVPCPSTDVLSPLVPASESRIETSDMDGDPETESTLQWPGQSPRLTESTLDENVVDGQMVSQGAVSSPRLSPVSHALARQESVGTREEEEEEELGGRSW